MTAVPFDLLKQGTGKETDGASDRPEQKHPGSPSQDVGSSKKISEFLCWEPWIRGSSVSARLRRVWACEAAWASKTSLSLADRFDTREMRVLANCRCCSKPIYKHENMRPAPGMLAAIFELENPCPVSTHLHKSCANRIAALTLALADVRIPRHGQGCSSLVQPRCATGAGAAQRSQSALQSEVTRTPDERASRSDQCVSNA